MAWVIGMNPSVSVRERKSQMSTGSHETLHVMFKYLAIVGWGIALVYLTYTSIRDYMSLKDRRAARRAERLAKRSRKKRR